MICTDPPYGLAYKSGHKRIGGQFDVIHGDNERINLSMYLDMRRVLRNDSVLAVFMSWKNAPYELISLSAAGFATKNVIVWDKHRGGMGDLKHTFATDYELCAICHKGKCQLRGKRTGSVWTITGVNPPDMVHPTQKPVALVERLIESFTDPGMVVYDPYAGSGTTGVACKHTNREFIGCEIDKKYYDVARKRMEVE